MNRPHTPRLAQWLLEHALPDPERTEITGDLAESFEKEPALFRRVRYWLVLLGHKKTF